MRTAQIQRHFVETLPLLEQHLEGTGQAIDNTERRLPRILSERVGSGAPAGGL